MNQPESNERDAPSNSNSPNSSAEMATVTRFVFVVCQPVVQNVCKQELARLHPELKPAFSRPGFLTFKTDAALPDRFNLTSTFARSFGWSKQNCADEEELGNCLESMLASDPGFKHIHVWNRDWTDNDKYRDESSEKAVSKLAKSLSNRFSRASVNQVAEPDGKVIDVIKVDDRWMVGWHIAGTTQQRWPGGIPLLDRDAEMVSRAYLKISEALLWSGVNIHKGDVCAEIGSAPGGSCLKLLQLGADVVAIDPAELDPRVANHKRLTHLKMRGHEVPHKALTDVRWLFVDSNVVPSQTLDTVEALAKGEKLNFRGVFLTLKFNKPELFGQIPDYIKRAKSWGFKFVKTRHLAYGRQEICLIAMKQKAVRRFRG